MIKETKVDAAMPLSPSMEVKHCPFHHRILVTQSSPVLMWMETIQEHQYQDTRIIGAILENACHNLFGRG